MRFFGEGLQDGFELTTNPKVLGSSPRGRANKIKGLWLLAATPFSIHEISDPSSIDKLCNRHNKRKCQSLPLYPSTSPEYLSPGMTKSRFDQKYDQKGQDKSVSVNY